MSHAKYNWQRNFVFDDMDVMNSLPGYLRRDVGNCLSERYFNQLSIFEDLSPYIRGLIALRLRCVSCNSNYKLFHAQQYGKELFIQRTGVSYLLDHNNKLHKITRGGVVGYFALLTPIRQTTLKCSSWCEFYALDRDDIQDILRTNFPRAWRPLWLKIKNRIKQLLEEEVASLNIDIKRVKDITFVEDKEQNKLHHLPSFDEEMKDSNGETIPLNTVITKQSKLFPVRTASEDTSIDIFEDSPKQKKSGSMTTNRRLRRSLSGLSSLGTLNLFEAKQKTVRVAKGAKTKTHRKFKKILQVSDSEMRNDKVLDQPTMRKLKKDDALRDKFEQRFKKKMQRKRTKRKFQGIDDFFNKSTNGSYFDTVVDEESTKLDTEMKSESIRDGNIFDASSEESDPNDDDSEDWGADKDESDSGAGHIAKKRGVSGIVVGRGSSFKGIKKVKMNKSSKGIRKMRIGKVKKKNKKHSSQRAKSVTPSSASNRQSSVTPPFLITNSKINKRMNAVYNDLNKLAIVKDAQNSNGKAIEKVEQNDDHNDHDKTGNKLQEIDEHASINS